MSFPDDLKTKRPWIILNMYFLEWRVDRKRFVSFRRRLLFDADVTFIKKAH